MGYEGPIPDPHFQLSDTETAPLTPLPFKTGYAGFHVGCLPNWKEKKYPLEHWAKVIDLFADAGFTPVLVGGQAEIQDSEVLASLTAKPLLNTVPHDLSLKRTAHVISQCRLFVSTDSGPMHVASALGVPTVGIFGPTSDVKNRPWKGRVVRWGGKINAEELLPCMPCQPAGMEVMRSCVHRRCLTELRPEAVFVAGMEAVNELGGVPG